MKLNPKEIVPMLALLIQMAKADEFISQNETLFLAQLAAKNGIRSSDYRLIYDEPEKYCVDLPNNEKIRTQFLFMTLSMMQMDNKACEREKAFAKSAGFLLGLRPEMVEELIDLFDRQISEEVPEKEFEIVLKKYLN
jgi:hypothetical protein